MLRVAHTCVALCLLLELSLQAAEVEYVINPSESLFTLTAVFSGVPLLPQTSGSNTIGFSGILGADREATTLSIESGSPFSLAQSILQLPGRFEGDTGSSFGFAGVSPIHGNIRLSVGRLALYISSDLRAPLDVADGQFGPTDFGFFVSDGSYQFSTSTIPRTDVDLHGTGAPNLSTKMGTLTTLGETETLTLPIESAFTRTSIVGEDTTFTLKGELVAHRTVPEPSVALLMSSGVAVLLHRGSFRHRHRT